MLKVQIWGNLELPNTWRFIRRVSMSLAQLVADLSGDDVELELTLTQYDEVVADECIGFEPNIEGEDDA